MISVTRAWILGIARLPYHAAPDLIPEDVPIVSSKETTPAAYLASLPLDLIGDIVASTPVERRIEAAEAARRKKK